MTPSERSAPVRVRSPRRPYLHEGCARQRNRSLPLCTNAHVLLGHIGTPLFIRENLFDVAKLANCGLDIHDARQPQATAYLQAWGRATRRALLSLRASNLSAAHGFYAPACLAHVSTPPIGRKGAPEQPTHSARSTIRVCHAIRVCLPLVGCARPPSHPLYGCYMPLSSSVLMLCSDCLLSCVLPLLNLVQTGSQANNLRFSSAPDVRGRRLIDAMHSWFFDAAAPPEQRFVMDDCGELPCHSSPAPLLHCPTLATVTQCGSLCRLQRQARRLRNGLNPHSVGRNVCELDEAMPSATSRTSGTPSAMTEAGSSRGRQEVDQHPLRELPSSSRHPSARRRRESETPQSARRQRRRRANLKNAWREHASLPGGRSSDESRETRFAARRRRRLTAQVDAQASTVLGATRRRRVGPRRNPRVAE